MSCEYQGYEFGAGSYPDSVCIDGRLHDADDCDDKGRIYLQEEDIPCPVCRPLDAVDYYEDRGNESGLLLVNDIRKNRGLPAVGRANSESG